RLLGVAGEEGEEGAAGHAGGAAGGGDPREAQMRQYTTNLEAVREMVKSDPRMAAQIIKEWISADE
ncbi:flagellar basal body M-ring protein FliF, partial [Chromobacterium aquaticum]|nr:flagellar basal body M-ring protein FliF [Chromobacterium aquaticum]